MYCSQCGKKLIQNAAFCSQCGFARPSLSETVGSAASASQPVIVNVQSYPVAVTNIDDMSSRPNVMAISSMWLGVGGIILMALGGIGGLLSIAAVILGHISSKRIKLEGQQGGAYALTGLILGYIGTAIVFVILLIVLGFAAVVASNMNNSPTTY